MRRTRITRKENGSFNLNIDLSNTDMKCLWHRLNQSAPEFANAYCELSESPAEIGRDEFVENDNYFLWNAIDFMLEYEDEESYDTNDEEPEHGN
jgi:hypothetical protein